MFGHLVPGARFPYLLPPLQTDPPLPSRRSSGVTSRSAGRTSRQVPRSLSALAEIAAALAGGDDVQHDAPRVLQVLGDQLGATAAALWLDGTGSFRLAWTHGDSHGLPSPVEIGHMLDHGQEHPTLALARIVAGGLTLGALGVVTAEQLGDEEHLLLAAVADVLAPVLRDAEYTQRLEAQVAERTREMEAQRLFTAKIVDTLPVGLYVIDRAYRIQAWNRKRETGTQGVSREEAIGRTIFEILHRQPAELLRAEFEDAFRTGRMQQFHVESDATGEARTYRLTKIPMRLHDAEVTHVITIGEDITEWRAAEDRFTQAEKLAAVGTLAAGVMHEINNPLATIGACAESIGYRLAEVPVAEPFAHELREGLRVIDDEVQRCKRIVESLLDFSRPRSATKSPVDLNATVEKTLFLLKHHARFKRLTVVTELGKNVPLLHGNEEQLVQVFMALLLNAMDAMDGKGTVTLRTMPDAAAHEVLAEVIDRGVGIRRAEVSKIFEPFYTTKPPGRGTGLGLSVCYAIVTEHGGRIEVESRVGEGSLFRIHLPMLDVTTP